MTQKELLYVEDAIEHESCIIDTLNYMENNLESEELSSFVNDEIKNHTERKDTLINLLKECSND